MKRPSVTDEAIARLLANGGKSLATRLPEAPAAVEPFVLEFHVAARPIPWKAATVLKAGGAFKDKKLVAWQRAVATCGRMAMMGREPFAGPVEIDVTFHLSPSKNGSVPDTTNLVKALEDSLQGVVIVNDRQVCNTMARRRKATIDVARVKVTSIEED
jgi:Holliday junction resolvase RusA-like endonuclease